MPFVQTAGKRPPDDEEPRESPPSIRERRSATVPILPALASGTRPALVAGSSPFHTKGLVFQGAREIFDKTVRGGTESVLAAVHREDGALGRYLEGPFAAGSWYDALPLVPLFATAARLRGVTPGKLTRELGAHLARRDLRGVYRAILQAGSLDAVAVRLPELTVRYFDFGEVQISRDGAQTALARRSGIPDLLVPFVASFVEGFTPSALALVGAVDVRVTFQDPKSETVASRFPTMRLEWLVSWT